LVSGQLDTTPAPRVSGVGLVEGRGYGARLPARLEKRFAKGCGAEMRARSNPPRESIHSPPAKPPPCQLSISSYLSLYASRDLVFPNSSPSGAHSPGAQGKEPNEGCPLPLKQSSKTRADQHTPRHGVRGVTWWSGYLCQIRSAPKAREAPRHFGQQSVAIPRVQQRILEIDREELLRLLQLPRSVVH